MKKAITVCVIIIMILAELPAQSLPKWEYTVYAESSKYPSVSLASAVLNSYGISGWELVSVNITSSGQWIYFFKREYLE